VGRELIQKKVCMLGGFAVGKTSLVSRYVHSMFSDTYLTTIGVKIDKKPVSLLRGEMELILWDIYGEDEFQKVRMSYLQGASAYLLVADGTRPATLEVAASLHRAAEQEIGKVPFVLALNKVDLADQWQVDTTALEEAGELGWKIVRTSAKTGEGVEEAFLVLARAMASR
jgi:small GTP-binding protein